MSDAMSAPAVDPTTDRPDPTGYADPRRLEKLRRRATHPLLWRLFMLAKLPLGLMAGIRVHELGTRRCVAAVPYGWRSTNPFASTYFAALAMAAELSTGALALLAAQSAPRSVAMLIVGLEAKFEKKATATTYFTCEAGAEVFGAVGKSLASGEAVAVRVETVGRAPSGEVVARFWFTWSFKVRAGAA